MISISSSDPLNLTGILVPGPRIPAMGGKRILYRDGVPVAVKSGKEISLLAAIRQADDWAIRNALLR